ncbi:MAG: hypothetical protein JWM68_4858 [Verrucomicrobiales bacterium]|nr:hypothetical protein [Verrucomicrobiales bacterium]
METLKASHNREIRHPLLWGATFIVVVFDFLIIAQALDWIHNIGELCGTPAYGAWKDMIHLAMGCAPVACYCIYDYIRLSKELKPLERFAARLPTTCFVALIFTVFVGFRFL